MQRIIKTSKPTKSKATKNKSPIPQEKPFSKKAKEDTSSLKKAKLFGRKDKIQFNKRKLDKNSSDVKTKKTRVSLPSDESSNQKQQKIAKRKQQETEMSESEAELDVDSELSHESDMEDETNPASDTELNNSKVDPSKTKSKRIKNKETQKLNWKDPEVQAELDSRTVFVGNVKATIKKSQLQKLFRKFGYVLSVRLRCITPAHPGVSKRMAAIKKLIHPKRTTVHAYVTFQKREDALKSLKLNGKKYEGHHLRVEICSDSGKPDPRKAIFVGNLPFDAEDDDLWTALESCGQIKSVRVVRNAGTGMGIGIGYVNFESTDAVELALQMDDVQVKNKVIRIGRYRENAKQGKVRQVKKKANVNKTDGQKSVEANGQGEQKKPLIFSVKKSAFQGSTSAQKKKKKKLNKGLLQKMRISRKIAPKVEN